MDTVDSSRYDDEDNRENGRNGAYRLHIGTRSHGCVTVCKKKDDDRSKEWEVVQDVINNTSTTEVPKREGIQWLKPWGKRKKYGTLKVIGRDKVKYKVKKKQKTN